MGDRPRPSRALAADRHRLRPATAGAWSRRELLRVVAGATALLGPSDVHAAEAALPLRPLRVVRTDSTFEREPLLRPFGFKGGYMTEIWQAVVRVESASGRSRIGLGTQNVLWSDAAVFASRSEAAGNAVMYAVTEKALALAREAGPVGTPLELLDRVLEPAHAYACAVTGRPDLRKTFALNALVPVDNAAWLLHADENGISGFDAMVPAEFHPALTSRHRLVAAIPLMAYAVPVAEIRAAVEQGFFFMKVKIGQPGTQEEMLERTRRGSPRSTRPRRAGTPHTKDGQPALLLRRQRPLREQGHAPAPPRPRPGDRRVRSDRDRRGAVPGGARGRGRRPPRAPRRRRERPHRRGRGATDRAGLRRDRAQAHRQDPQHDPAHRPAGPRARRAVLLRRPDGEPDPGRLEQDHRGAARARSPGSRSASWRPTATRTTGTGRRCAATTRARGRWTLPDKGVFRLDPDFYARSGGIFERSRTTRRCSAGPERSPGGARPE